MRILFTGGGSGGHFFPILAVIRELKRIAEEERILDLDLFYMGPDRTGEELLKEEGVMVLRVPTGKLRRYFSLQNAIDPSLTVLGILRALWNIFLIMPDVIFSKGGYGSLPAVAAAFIFRIPLVIHESDAAAGGVSKFSARFAKRIGIAFKGAADFFPKEKTALVGVPVRTRILGVSRETGREHMDVFSQLPVVGFIGASQGAQKINEAVLGTLKELTGEFEVIHQTGIKNIAGVKEEAEVILTENKERYHPFGFLDEFQIRDFYAASDLVVARASATTIYEIAAWGKPSILLPLNHAAQDHQRKNAYEYAATGACVVIEEQNLTPHILFSEIKKLFADPEKMKKMGEAAKKFSRPESGEIVAREILKLGIH